MVVCTEMISSLSDPDGGTITVPMAIRPRWLSGEMSLSSFSVAGGWIGGEYEVRLRVRYFPVREEGPAASVTMPIRFSIR